MATPRKKISAKVRAEAIKLVIEDGLTTGEVAKKKGLGKSTVGKFVSDYRKAGNKITMKDEDDKTPEKVITPNQSELQELRNKVRKLNAEKEVLKKTIAILMADH